MIELRADEKNVRIYGAKWITYAATRTVEWLQAQGLNGYLRRGSHRSTRELEDAIGRHIDATNVDLKPFVWTKTADQILASVARFCSRTLEQHS